MFKAKSLCVLAAAAAFGAFATPALAVPTDVISTGSSTLTSPNTDISCPTCGTGPYGTIFISLDVTTQIATITFTSNTSGNPAYLFIDNHEIDANINSTNFTAAFSGFTQTGSGFHVPTAADFSVTVNTAGVNVDNQGSFNLIIEETDGFGSAVNSVTFTVTNNGTPFTSAADVLTTVGNGMGVDAAAHVAVTSNVPPPTGNGINQGNNAIQTGFAGETGGVVNTPEPATLALLGTALAGLGFFSRRRRQQS